MRTRTRGATLMEIVFSIFLVSILMTLFANLVTRYSKIIYHQDKSDRMLANVAMALDTVTCEIEEALLVELPDSDGQSRNDVKLQRYDPQQTSEDIADRELVTVDYYLESGVLYRRITGSGGVMAYPVAHEVAGFSVRRDYSRLFTVTVSFERANGSSSLDGKACLKSGI